MPLFSHHDNHMHSWGPALATVPGNLAGAVLIQRCTICGKRRRCRAA